MDLPWGDERSTTFVTNVGLITSNGPHGNNIMSAEWTHHISYTPGLILVCVGHGKATEENIKTTKEFGISLCTTEQAMMASVAGNNSGKTVQKIKVLEALGFTFFKAQHINTLMVKDAVLTIECKLVKQLDIGGSHMLFIGEVLDAKKTPGKAPVVYHLGKYFNVGEHIAKPPQEVLTKIKSLIEKNTNR